MQPDIKKLITAFLGIAFLASTLGFSLLHSGVFDHKEDEEGVATEGDTIKNNAFADISQVTPPWRTPQTPSSSNKLVFSSSNLTENFSLVASHEFVAAATAKDGEIDKDALFKAVQEIETQAFQVPTISSSDIKINPKPTPQDHLIYVEKVRDILLSTSRDFLPKNAANATPDIANINSVKSFFESKKKQVSALNVPEDLVPLHKSLLSFMIGHQNFFENLTIYEKDPVKTLLALQNKEKVLGSYVDTLTAELGKVSASAKLGKFSPPQSSPQTANPIISLFTPQVAHAQQATIDIGAIGTAIANGAQAAAQYAKDIAHYIKVETADIRKELDDARKWVQTQLEWANKLATEQLKNVLVQLFVQQSIAWINGDGNPQFVTNWKVYANYAMDRGINKGFGVVEDDACGTFGNLMMDDLNTSFNTYYVPSRCQQNSTGQALNSFRTGSFYNGGWDAYGYAVSPKGNYYQSYSDYSTQIGKSRDAEMKAAIDDVIANEGFTSVKECADSDVQGPPSPDGTCPDGSEPQATTPGSTFGALLAESFIVPTGRIVNANDLYALAFTLANGALAKTRAAGSRGITSLGDGASFSVSVAAQTLADSCSSYASGTPGHASCLQNAGAADLVQTDLDNQVASTSASVAADQALENLKNQAQSVVQLRNTLTSVKSTSITLIEDLIVRINDPLVSNNTAILDQVIQVCGNQSISGPGPARVAEARAAKTDLQTLLGAVNSMSSVDDDLMATDLSILSQSTDIAQVRNQLTQFQATYGTVASTTALLTLAQDRRVEIRAIKTQAEANLPNLCTTPIQRVSSTLLINP